MNRHTAIPVGDEGRFATTGTLVFSNPVDRAPTCPSPSDIRGMTGTNDWVLAATITYVHLNHRVPGQTVATKHTFALRSATKGTQTMRFGVRVNADVTGSSGLIAGQDIRLKPTETGKTRELAIKQGSGSSEVVYHVHLGNIIW